MFLTSTTAAGKRYFYLAQYVGGRSYSKKRYKHIYNFGNEKVAFERFSLWSLDNSFIPPELILLGVTKECVKKWKNKVVELTKRHHKKVDLIKKTG